jgi:glycosyltransferase involved in cell wall biosynthesis
MTRMRLTIIHPDAELYGADRMLLATIDAVKNVFEVTVVLPCYGALLEEINARNVQAIVEPSLVVLRKELMNRRGLMTLGPRFLVSLVRLLFLMARLRPSLVYVNTITLPLVLVAARMRGTPTVCHVHEAEVGLHPFVHRLLTAPLFLATRIVSISSASSAFITGEWARLGRRIEVIPNGVAFPSVTRPLSHTPPNRPAILLPGRISPRKGTDLAIEAVRALSNVGRPCRLTLAGSTFPGYEWFEAQLRSKVKQYNLEDDVIFAGFREDMATLYDEADIVLVPSRVEPFGLVAVEAMLAARVLIASDVPGLREVVEHGRTGWLARPSAESLCRAVLERLDDWDASVARADGARGVAMSRFGVVCYHSRIRHLLEEVCSASPIGAPVGLAQRVDPDEARGGGRDGQIHDSSDGGDSGHPC